MVFHSFGFIFAFLPLSLLVFFAAVRAGKLSIAVLGLGLAFCACFNPYYALLAFVQMIGSWFFIRRLDQAGEPGRSGWFAWGLLFNSGFLIGLHLLLKFGLGVDRYFVAQAYTESIVWPVGTTCIAFLSSGALASVYRKPGNHLAFGESMAAILFFPSLVVGPLGSFSDFVRQIREKSQTKILSSDLDAGMTYFTIGLFKKIQIADRFFPFAESVFTAAGKGHAISTVDSWIGAVSWVLQLYFNLSGYADMARGISRILGFHLPASFNSPFFSRNILEYWNRWNLTFTRTVSEIIFEPLRESPSVALGIACLVGSLCYGFSVPILIFALVNLVFIILVLRLPLVLPNSAARGVTLLFVIATFILLKADTWTQAAHIWQGLVGMSTGSDIPLKLNYFRFIRYFSVVAFVLLFCPETERWVHGDVAILQRLPQGAFRLVRGFILGVMMLASLAYIFMENRSDFIYF